MNIFFCTPTNLYEWIDIAYNVNNSVDNKVVGQLINSSESHKHRNINWVLFDSDYMSNIYFHNYSLYNDKIDNSIINDNINMYNMIMMRDHWYLFKNESVNIFKFYYLYWMNIVSNYNIDIVVFNITPHRVFDYPLYCLCHYKGVNKLICTRNSILNKIFTRHSVKYDAYYDNRLFNNSYSFKIPEKFINYENKILKSYEYAEPYYMKKQKRNNVDKKIKSFIHKRNWYSAFFYKPSIIFRYLIDKLKKDKYINKLKNKYILSSVYPDYNSKYIYIPLHYQPERTTIPEGMEYADQVELIKKMNTIVPKDYYIYVKEHPSQFMLSRGWQGRDSNYYNRILSIDNRIKLIDINTDPFNLIDNSLCVITITGTSAIESILRGTPAFIMGYPWFYPALNKEKYSYNTIINIENNSSYIIKEQRKSIIQYMNNNEKNGKYGYTERGSKTNEENSHVCIKNITKLILRDIKYIKSNKALE